MTPVEQRILVWSAVGTAHAVQPEEMARAILSIKDKDRLISIAAREGLSNLLFKSLLSSNLFDLFNEKQKKTLMVRYYHTIAFNLRLLNDLKDILKRLNREAIPVVLLQGAILLQQAYTDIGVRPMSDIDLWVRKEYYPAFVRVLTEMGYQRDPLYPNTFQKGSTILDVHTHIFWADRIKTRALIMSKGQGAIYRSTRVADFEGRKVLSLNTYDQVLYLCLHLLKHNTDRLIWLVDVQRLTAEWNALEWSNLMARGKELGTERPLAYIVFLLQRILKVQFTGETCQNLKKLRLNTWEKKILKSRTTERLLPVWAPLLLFSPGNSAANRTVHVLESLFPSPEVLRQVYPGPPQRKSWHLYVKRLGSLLGII